MRKIQNTKLRGKAYEHPCDREWVWRGTWVGYEILGFFGEQRKVGRNK